MVLGDAGWAKVLWCSEKPGVPEALDSEARRAGEEVMVWEEGKNLGISREESRSCWEDLGCSARVTAPTDLLLDELGTSRPNSALKVTTTEECFFSSWHAKTQRSWCTLLSIELKRGRLQVEIDMRGARNELEISTYKALGTIRSAPPGTR